MPMMQHNSCCAFDSLVLILTLPEQWVSVASNTKNSIAPLQKKKKKKKKKKERFHSDRSRVVLFFDFSVAFDITRRVNSVLARVDAVRRAAGWADELPPSGSAENDFVIYCICFTVSSFFFSIWFVAVAALRRSRLRCGSMRVAHCRPTVSMHASSSNIALLNAISTLCRATVVRHAL
jgi:hypothetical protein